MRGPWRAARRCAPGPSSQQDAPWLLANQAARPKQAAGRGASHTLVTKRSPFPPPPPKALGTSCLTARALDRLIVFLTHSRTHSFPPP
jgi:hypothetical protein